MASYKRANDCDPAFGISFFIGSVSSYSFFVFHTGVAGKRSAWDLGRAEKQTAKYPTGVDAAAAEGKISQPPDFATAACDANCPIQKRLRLVQQVRCESNANTFLSDEKATHLSVFWPENPPNAAQKPRAPPQVPWALQQAAVSKPAPCEDCESAFLEATPQRNLAVYASEFVR